MSPNELLREKREDILRIASKRGASNVRVFGSVARGEADSKSDIDLLVDLEPGRSLYLNIISAACCASGMNQNGRMVPIASVPTAAIPTATQDTQLMLTG